MKRILILLSLTLITATGWAQQRRYTTKIIQFAPIATPSAVSNNAELFYRSSDSSMCVVNVGGTTTRLSGVGGASAGGSTTQVQYNNAGVLAGDAGMTYIAANNKIIVDTAQAIWRIAAGSSSTQVLFNNGTIAAGDAGMVYTAASNKLTVDTTQTTWRIATGSSSTQVLFNNGTIAAGDAGMVYTAASNKLTVDSVVAAIVLPNGTAANPSVYFANSTGVGFYRSASNVLGIATAGSERLTVDAQGDLNIAGGRGVNSAADTDMWATFMPTDAQQALTDTGAANVTSYYTALTTTVASPVTLASGTQIGQLKKIALVVDVGFDATLTLTGYTSIVFNDAGDYVLLLWNGAAWFATENSGTTITP